MPLEQPSSDYMNMSSISEGIRSANRLLVDHFS